MEDIYDQEDLDKMFKNEDGTPYDPADYDEMDGDDVHLMFNGMNNEDSDADEEGDCDEDMYEYDYDHDNDNIDLTYRTYKKEHIIFLGNLYSLLDFFSFHLIALQQGNRWKYNVCGDEGCPFNGFDIDVYQLPHVPSTFSTEDLIDAIDTIEYLKENIPEDFLGWIKYQGKEELIINSVLV